MTDSRETFIDIYKKLDEETKTEYQKLWHYYFENDLQTRLFEKCEKLIDENDLKATQQQFISIFENVKCMDVKPEDIAELLSDSDRDALTKLQQQLIDAILTVWVDHKHKIKKDVIHELNWHDFKDKLNAASIVRSFLSSLNQLIFKDSDAIWNKNIKGFEAMCQFIGAKRAEWVNNALANFKPEKPKKDKQVNSHSSHSESNISTGVTVLSVGLTFLTSIGYLAWQKYDKSKNQSKENPFATNQSPLKMPSTEKDLNFKVGFTKKR